MCEIDSKDGNEKIKLALLKLEDEVKLLLGAMDRPSNGAMGVSVASSNALAAPPRSTRTGPSAALLPR